MKKILAPLLALTLAACGTPEDNAAPGDQVRMDKSWQVVGIYTAADATSSIPESVQPAPSLTLGTQGLVGTSGCAQFRADATYLNGEEESNVEDADAVRIDSVHVDDTRADCTGESLWAHNQLTRLLAQDHEFTLRVDENNQMVFTLRDGRVDSPAIRFVSLAA